MNLGNPDSRRGVASFFPHGPPRAKKAEGVSMRRWLRRQAIWDTIYGGLFAAIKPMPLPQPSREPVPVRSWFDAHKQALDGVITGFPTPADEHTPAKGVATRAIYLIRSAFPQIVPGAPLVPQDPEQLMATAWTRHHERAYDRRPQLPPELANGLDLGQLAVSGPFSTYVARQDDGSWVIDLSELGTYAHKPGMRNLGTLTRFRREGRRLVPVSILETAAGRLHRPEDASWHTAARLVCCGLLTHTTVIRHGGICHFLVSGTVAVAVRNCLPADHPMMQLLWPHVHGALDVNNTLAPPLLYHKPGHGVFNDVFNLEIFATWELVSDSTAAFRFEGQDPTTAAAARGLDRDELDAPTHEDAMAVWHIIRDYTRAWVDHHYPSDAAVEQDHVLAAFLDRLEELVPNGIGALAPRTRAGLARLAAIVIHNAAVDHHIVGNLLWNYSTWPMFIPCNMDDRGNRPRLDVFQRYFNILFASIVPTRSLMTDWADLGPDAESRAIMRRFKVALANRQVEMEQAGPHAVHRVYPDELRAVVGV